ncbi:hypothetical protein H4R26_003390 [Coemansia thaxteri]|uniref:MHD domain-containing protein n=1 Tax=Coemansia thaxteri TaxID=2663907 RepID=A0A9W8EJ80_9FUNG|nr:hypothetical protein H4R26_003390 [Coemansia thaxteri]
MAFFATLKAAVNIATSQSYDIDWREPKVKEAAIVHWEEVKAAADPALPLAGLRLTAEQKSKLDELLKGESVFPDQPTDELLDGMPDAIPSASLNRICGSIIDNCLNNHNHAVVAASDDVAIQRASLVVVPAFSRYLRSVASLHDAEPVWSAPLDTVCIHVQRGELIYVGVVSREVAALEVLELLEGVQQALGEYIGHVTELTLKENFATVYQLLSEMVDSGSAVTTDTAVLRGLVPVPSLVDRVIENVAGIGMRAERRPAVNTSSTPWRAPGIRHTNNEIFVDVVERIDATVEAGGAVAAYDVSGDISCNARLTGMPDLLLAVNRADAMDDVAFHPCVRAARWDAERVIAFVPPDGQFKLASFHVAADPAASPLLPLRLHAATSRLPDQSHAIEISADAGHTAGRPVEKIHVRVPLPANAYNIRVQCKAGSHTVSNVRLPQVEWSLKALRPTERGARLTIHYLLRAPSASEPPLSAGNELGAQAAFVDFEVAGYSISSLKVESLKLLRESYKIFKGVRYVTKAGSFQLRF